MNDYILFIDTETSDIPKQWYASTKNVDKWPYILQIAWTICNKQGEQVITRDFYINPGNIEYGKESQRLHGITPDFLRENGIERETVMKILFEDISSYQPMIVGHFLDLDRKMMEVGFARANIEQNFKHLPKFCTMRNTRYPFDTRETPRFLRLNELYRSLFDREMTNQHNALADALATKECFFEQVNRGEITEKTIQRQQRYFRRRQTLPWTTIIIFALAAVSIVIYISVVLIRAGLH
jgi:DNA polymerase III subunit epsilon